MPDSNTENISNNSEVLTQTDYTNLSSTYILQSHIKIKLPQGWIEKFDPRKHYILNAAQQSPGQVIEDHDTTYCADETTIHLDTSANNQFSVKSVFTKLSGGSNIQLTENTNTGITTIAITGDIGGHWTTRLHAGTGDATNAATSNPFLTVSDSNAVRTSVQLSGGTGIAISSDNNGVVTINNTNTTDNDTHYTTKIKTAPIIDEYTGIDNEGGYYYGEGKDSTFPSLQNGAYWNNYQYNGAYINIRDEQNNNSVNSSQIELVGVGATLVCTEDTEAQGKQTIFVYTPYTTLSAATVSNNNAEIQLWKDYQEIPYNKIILQGVGGTTVSCDGNNIITISSTTTTGGTNYDGNYKYQNFTDNISLTFSSPQIDGWNQIKVNQSWLTAQISGFILGLEDHENSQKNTLKRVYEGGYWHLRWCEDLVDLLPDYNDWYKYGCNDTSITFDTNTKNTNYNNIHVSETWLTGKIFNYLSAQTGHDANKVLKINDDNNGFEWADENDTLYYGDSITITSYIDDLDGNKNKFKVILPDDGLALIKTTGTGTVGDPIVKTIQNIDPPTGDPGTYVLTCTKTTNGNTTTYNYNWVPTAPCPPEQ